jgi:hypothetical protein
MHLVVDHPRQQEGALGVDLHTAHFVDAASILLDAPWRPADRRRTRPSLTSRALRISTCSWSELVLQGLVALDQVDVGARHVLGKPRR